MNCKSVTLARFFSIVIISISFMSLSACGSKSSPVKSVTVQQVAVKSMCATSVDLFAYSNANIADEHSLSISAEIAGTKLAKIECKDNARVSQGQAIFELSDNGVRQGNLDSEKINLAKAKSVYERQKKLMQSKSTSEQALEDAKSAYDLARVSESNAQNDFNLLTIKAPFAGVLHNCNSVLGVGDKVTPQDMLVTLSSKEQFKVNYYLSEAWLGKAKPGQSINVYHNGNLVSTGLATSVDHDINKDNGAFAVTAHVKANALLVSGENVTIKQRVGKLDHEFVVPALSLQTQAGGFAVYVVRNNHVSLVSVKVVNDHDGDNVIVLSGLKQGDLVVSAGMSQLHDGDKVKIDQAKSTMRCAP
jgi:membrane fusion protein, multidrug efflux system